MTAAPGARSVVRRTDAQIATLRDGATLVRTSPAVFRVEGPGAVDCVQGLLTNDVVRHGPDGLVYGACLTSKGMIVVDVWVLRDPAGLTIVSDPAGHGPALEIFARQLPPRLARVTDRTGSWEALWLLGAGSEGAARSADLPWPGPGKVVVQPGIPAALEVARADLHAPWAALALSASPTIADAALRLIAGGARLGVEEDLEAVRVLRGWPRLGVEIGDKTLPQEVRYDEIGGVSYTKGCYTGQETVARLHFRGRPNWFLRGLVGRGEAPAPSGVWADGKPVGEVQSLLQVDAGWLATGRLRREVEPGATVRVGDSEATVVTLPFEPGP